MNHSGRIIALLLGALLYLGYIGLCAGMEPIARSRARVLSKADVAALSSSPAAIAERDRAMKRMYAWPPYLGYLTIVTAVVLGGSVWGARLARRRRLLVFLAVFAILAAPPIVSRWRAESHRTGFTGRRDAGAPGGRAERWCAAVSAAGPAASRRRVPDAYRVRVSPRCVDMTSAFSRSMPWRLSSIA